MSIRCISCLSFTAVLLTLGIGSSQACFMRSPLPVQVWMDHIHVDIVDQVATKTYHCTFKNANPQAVVGGTCYMELEPGAQVDNMSVLIDGQEHQAEILDADRAKHVFTDMVKNGGSPALLEYFGNQLIQTQVPRIEPNGTVTVKLQYTTVLPLKGDLVRLQMLNTNPKALMQTLASASVAVNLRSQRPVKNVYSPTHKIKLVEKPGWDVSLTWSAEEYLPRHPFVLYYQVGKDRVGASVVAHKERDEEGAFLLMVSPAIGRGPGALSEADILPKDVVFCVDTSGSMLEGNKMTQARGALRYCLNTLREGDRFNIVDFSTVARSLSDDGLLELTPETRARALEYVEDLHARGGTAIQEALETSLQHLQQGATGGDPHGARGTLRQDSRLQMIVFATDGLPTVGETDPRKLLARIARENDIDARLFVFGEGYDVNTSLLDFLALDHRGEADYILPDEDIEERISRFFDRVGSPVMTDLKIDFGGLPVEDVYPRKVSDIYRGEQVVILGRYTGGGEHTVTLTGNVKGKRQSFRWQLHFPERSDDDKSAFVHRLWAGRKVDFLLSEIRQQDVPPEELVGEVTRLAKRYGIVTPYTSFLMTDDVVRKQERELTDSFRGLRRSYFGEAASAGGAAPSDESVRQLNVEAAKLSLQLRRGGSQSGGLDALEAVAEDSAQLSYGFSGQDAGALPHLSASSASGRPQRPSLAAIRSIGTRTFYHSNDVWYESEFDPGQTPIQRTIKVGSKAYVQLLMDDVQLAKFFALGDVVLQINDDWVRIES